LLSPGTGRERGELHDPLRHRARPVHGAGQPVALRRMCASQGFERRPQLRVVRPAKVVDREALGRELLACIADRPEGLPPAELLPDLAARLDVHVDDIDEHDLDVAVGLLVVTGRIDEAGGLLIALDTEHSRAIG